MAAKSLKIDSLELDLENPRITLATDQRDAMQKILKEQKIKIINLAESIAEKGFSPLDRCLVLRQANGRFTVLEGNRRVFAAELLKNPSLVETLEMSENFRKRLQKAASTFVLKKVEPVDCFEVANKAEGIEWISRRHTGEDEGRGTIPWSAGATARFKGRDAALQALDFVSQYGDLTEEQADLLAGKFPLTTLDRLLSTPGVRKVIGFELVEGKLKTELPPEEALRPLRRIVLDLAEKRKKVSDLMLKDQQIAYVNTFTGSEKANLTKKTGNLAPIEEFSAKDFATGPEPVTKTTRFPKAGPRSTLVEKTCKLNVTNPKVAGIFGELRTLKLSKHVHAIGVLLRVFVEMSVDEYLTNVAKVPLSTTNSANDQRRDKYLKTKLNETIEHMVKNGAPDKEFKGVRSAMATAENPFSLDTLHAYVHNRFFTPIDTHLTAAWDNGQPLFEGIWPA